MTNKEAVIWLINIVADIGKAEHRDLWHYEQALCEIREMLEGYSNCEERKKGQWEEKTIRDDVVITEWQSARCPACKKYHTTPYMYFFHDYNYCPECGADMRGLNDEVN